MISVMRGAFAFVGCMLGATCTSGLSPHNESTEEIVVHTPPGATLSPVASAPSETGPFWQQRADGRAVPILRRDAPNMRYAAMDRATCEAELQRRAVPFARAEDSFLGEGVLAPVRLRGGALSNGVTIHSELAPRDRATSPMEVFDCRLVLALDDFAAQLKARGIVEMIHLSAFRSRKSFGCTPKYDGKQHCGALAVDIATFKRADGTTLDVMRDYRGRVGATTCVSPASEIESIVCDAADRATFNVMLTPNFNAQHRNHVHVEITPDAAWMMIH